MTTIEGWEIDRHRTLARRARAFGGFLDGPDGTKIRIVKQEFPYDIGIWSNINQGMGGNLFTWFWPFASTPSARGGLTFEVNGFEGKTNSFAYAIDATRSRILNDMASSGSRPHAKKLSLDSSGTRI